MQPINKENPFRISVDWEKKSKLLRRRYPQLTHSDLSVENEDENSLLEKIEKRLHKNRIEVLEIIENTFSNKFVNNLKIQYHE